MRATLAVIPDLGALSIRLIQTPGHTEGSLYFLIGDYFFS
jgi:glyoxylase-like metal-dependent hydrolase (beta-lactamase superfamily II)